MLGLPEAMNTGPLFICALLDAAGRGAGGDSLERRRPTGPTAREPAGTARSATGTSCSGNTATLKACGSAAILGFCNSNTVARRPRRESGRHRGPGRRGCARADRDSR
jgi:hypothetical protein